jgi:hypothetical protein
MIVDGVIAIEPSYFAKLRRAEHHLRELGDAIDTYADSHPYTFEILSDRRPTTGRLKFTSYPENTDIPIIAADAIYNIRSALDHLMAALVPANRERKVYFPILFDGVWEDPPPGENQGATRDRERWATYVKGAHPQAVAILRTMQPSLSESDSDPTINFLVALNHMAVRDRHTRLPLTAPTLANFVVTVTRPDGKRSTGWGDAPGALHHGGLVTGLPDGIVDAEIRGDPVIAVRVGGPTSYLRLPDSLVTGLRVCGERIVAPLLPFVRV